MTKEKEVSQEDKPLSIRERMTLHLLFLMMTIIKPMQHAYEWEEIMKEITELMKSK